MNFNCYTVYNTAWGKWIQGRSIPVNDLSYLMKSMGRKAVWDFLIAWSYPSCIAAIAYDKKKGKEWREYLKELGTLYDGPINGINQNEKNSAK